MAYNDRYGQQANHGHYPPQQQYGNDDNTEYNPYSYPQQYQPYDQGGYGYHDTGYAGGYSDDPNVPNVAASKEQDRSVFEDDPVQARKTLGPKTSSAMRRWRYEHQGNLWTKGGRGRCIGRFCCCSIMIFLFFLISIIFSLALGSLFRYAQWIRPPDVEVNGIQPTSSGSTLQIQDDGIAINLMVNLTVNNPNYFSVKFDDITADIIYPINNTHIGGGTLKDLTIHSNQLTRIEFPFSINYTSSIDPDMKIMTDLLSRCSGSGADITVKYKIALDFKVIVIPIKPVISNSITFPCPLTTDDIKKVIQSLGGSGGLGGLNLGDILTSFL
ncbi:hypothetical protein K474DRAFT_1681087 [Panus rudis PR-1116 ss-1]|nr:hypothetical protein K474DRAFT_1681087 [Panus rudis PR-1116 ss-1]